MLIVVNPEELRLVVRRAAVPVRYLSENRAASNVAATYISKALPEVDLPSPKRRRLPKVKKVIP